MSCESVAPSHAKTIGTNFALKSFHAIINLISELWNTIELPLRILYFTPNFTDMLLCVIYGLARYSFFCFRSKRVDRCVGVEHEEYLEAVDLTSYVGTIPTWLASHFLV